MAIKKLLAISIIATISFNFLSCDNATGPVSNVSGTVYGFDYVPLSNTKVIIGDQSVITSEVGSFAFSGVSFPFDVIVFDSLDGYSTIFKDLSSEHISLPLERFVPNYEYASVHVKIPNYIIQSNSIGKIIFTDGIYFSTTTDIATYDTVTTVNVYLNVSVTGKLLALTYKRDPEGKITTYENYGESPDIEIQPGGNYFYEFDSLSLSLNPGEETITGSFDIPSGSYSSYSDFHLSFSSKRTYFGSRFSLIQSDVFSFKIPTGLPRQFKTVVTNDTYGGNVGSSYSEFVVYPNIPNRLEIYYAPVLTSPDNEVKNVSNSTQFSFGSGTGNGIYIISLHNQSRFVSYSIVTSNTNFTLEGIENIGFGSINNNNFRWHVNKIGPSGSMNDYVTGFANEQNVFSLRSNDRFFSTLP